MLIIFAQVELAVEGYDFSKDAYQNTANRIATYRQDIRNKKNLPGAENESGIKRKNNTLTKIASKKIFKMPFYFIRRLF